MKFRTRVNGGAWTERDENLPYTIPGVTSGDTVDVEVLGVTVSLPSAVVTVWDLPATPGRGVTINARRSNLQVAPEAFQFDITTSGFTTNTLADETAYDPSYHDKSVFWDYGDSYQFTAPEKVMAANLDSQFSRGPLGSHTFRSAGDYVVRVAVIEHSSGDVAFGEYLIGGAGEDTPSIQDPDVLFAGSATLFVDNNGAAGGYPNAPAGATLYDTLQWAITEMPSVTGLKRVVLERGQTHEIPGYQNFVTYATDFVGPTTFRIEANTGAGAKPILTLNDAAFSNGGLAFNDALRGSGTSPNAEADIVFAGLDVRGLWDSTTETGKSVTFMLSSDAGSGYTLLDDCEFSGWRIVYQGVNNARETIYTINDTVVTDWQEYAFIEGSAQVSSAFIGTRMSQHVDALSGGPREDPPTHNNQGPFRLDGPKGVNLWACDIFSRNGWAQDGDVYEPQPCIRYGGSKTVGGSRMNLGGSVLESGGTSLTIGLGDSNNPELHVNAVIDGNIMLGGFKTTFVAGSDCSGSTWRNNFLIQPNVQRDTSSIGGTGYNNSMLRFRVYDTPPVNQPDQALVYNNTFVNLISEANYPGPSAATQVIVNETVVSIVDVNNIVHEPNIAVPRTLYGSTNVAPPDGTLQAVSVFTPRYNGYRDFDTTPTLATQFATPADSGQILVPASGSPALGAATTGQVSRVDYTGDLRPDPAAVGAAESA